jgi:hypothetical protein
MIELTPVLIIASAIVLVIGLIYGFKINIKYKGFTLGFAPKGYKDIINQVITITDNYATKREAVRSSIIRDQLNFLDGIMTCIRKTVDANIVNTIQLMLKISLKENGFERLDTHDFSVYVGSQIDRIRAYVTTADKDIVLAGNFADLIASVFNQAILIHTNASEQLELLADTKDKELASIIKI